MKRRVDIGLLHSLSGNYAALSQTARNGVLQGVAEVNADPSFDLALTVTERDPEGRTDRYAPLCRELLRETGARHIFGCITSASRKEVIPELERYDGVLWYPAPHEGFEASERVGYVHSGPNQHLLPLLDWALPNLGTRGYLVGSNYIWGWEIAQIARERMLGAGAQVTGDRYLALGDTDTDHILAEIEALKPDFVLNSLIGASSYALLERLQDLRRRTGARLPVLSCNFTEAEFHAAGPACEGLVAAGPWFETGSTQGGSISEMSRQSVHELARLLHGRPGAERLGLSQLISDARLAGTVTRLDPSHLHARQPVVIAVIDGGRFRPLLELPVRDADPYLTGRDRALPVLPALRVVS